MIHYIEDIPTASPAELAGMPVTELLRFNAMIDARAKQLAQIQGAWHAALAARFAKPLNSTGTHHSTEDGVAVSVTIPKRVKYDQGKLAAAVETIKGWGENPADYVDSEIKVSERKYEAWPPSIRDLFTPARTVEHGKAVIKLSLAEQEAA